MVIEFGTPDLPKKCILATCAHFIFSCTCNQANWSTLKRGNKSTDSYGYNLSAVFICPSIFLSDMTQRVIRGVQLLLCWCPEGEWVWQALEVTFMQWVATMVLHHFRVWRGIIRTPTSGVEWHPWTAEEQVWHTVLVHFFFVFCFYVSS